MLLMLDATDNSGSNHEPHPGYLRVNATSDRPMDGPILSCQSNASNAVLKLFQFSSNSNNDAQNYFWYHMASIITLYLYIMIFVQDINLVLMQRAERCNTNIIVEQLLKSFVQ
jgi:hypothetical protein